MRTSSSIPLFARGFRHLSTPTRAILIALIASRLIGCAGTTDGTTGPVVATQLKFTTQPASGTGGSAIAPAVVVSVLDATGAVVTSATTSITISLTAGSGATGAALGGTLTSTAVAGVATFSNLTIDKVGTGYTLTAAASGLTSATSAAFAVTPGAPAKLAFAVQPTATNGGSAIAPTIQVAIQDLGGNTVTTATNSVTVSLTGGGTGAILSGTKTVAAIAGIATFTGLSIDKVGTTNQITAAATGLTSATSNAFAVVTGPAATLTFVQQPTSVFSGQAAGQFGVAITDLGGNTVTTATNSVTLAITPGTGTAGATLGGTLTKAALTGLATFPDITIDKLGTGYTLTATSTGLTAGTSAAFAVTVGAAAKLIVTTTPASLVSGQNATFVVQVTDAAANLVTTATNSVTLALNPATNTTGATLLGTTTVAAVNGVATFGNVSVDKMGAGYTLVASSTGLTSANSGSFGVTAGAASQIAINAGNNQSAAIGSSVAIAPSVIVKDANGNPVSLVNVTFAVASGGGSITGPTQSTSSTGTATVGSWTLGGTAGANTLTATATGLTGSPITFTATGVGVSGSEFVIANSANEEDFGGVATDGTNYLASVQTKNVTSNVAAQLLSPTGAPIGGQIVVGALVGDPVKIAFDGTNYLMVWGDHTTSTVPILGQFVSKTGTLVGSTFTINAGTSAQEGVSAIAYAGGTYFVVYTREAGGPSGASNKTYGRTVAAAGTVGAELTLSSGYTTPDGPSSSLTFDGSNFFAVYTDQATVQGRFVSAAGVLGSEVTVLTASGYTVEKAVGVAFNGTNFLVTVPRKLTGASTADALAQLVSGSGAPIGGLIDIASDPNVDEFPVGVLASGSNFVVSYMDSLSSAGQQRIRVRFVSGSGTALGSSMTIASSASGKSPLGGLFLYNGTTYFEFVLRGVPNAGDPSNFELWTQRDLYGALLSIPTPGP